MNKLNLLFIFVLLLSFNTLYSNGQKELDTRIILGGWEGEILLGESFYRLVFNFSLQNDDLIGHVDSPDKGVYGIPFSKVEMENNTIYTEIDVANILFEGIIENGSINGVWLENGIEYNITLFPYDELVVENKTINIPSILDKQQSFDQFNFYYSNEEKIDELHEQLLITLTDIEKKIEVEFIDQVNIFIYPDIESFHISLGITNGEQWLVGAASHLEIRMVSPLNPGEYHNNSSLNKAIIHELWHVAVLELRGQKGAVGLPIWLNEGLAYYEAGQFTDEVKNSLDLSKIPSLNQMDQIDAGGFSEINGYGFSASIVEFLILEFGYDKIKEFILNPDEFSTLYNMELDELEKEWKEFLIL